MSGCRVQRDIRRVLFESDPHCHWCGCLTLWDLTPGKIHKAGATLDHIGKNSHDDRFVVLACFDCNQLRERFKAVKRTEQTRTTLENRIAKEIEWFKRRLDPDWVTVP